MKITINKTEEKFDFNECTITELLDVKNYVFKLLIIRVNGVFVFKDKYEETIIRDGDNVEIIHMISGG